MGPCILCGEMDYPLSMGGPNICPACDCGVDPVARKLKKQLAESEAENRSLKEQLSNLLK